MTKNDKEYYELQGCIVQLQKILDTMPKPTPKISKVKIAAMAAYQKSKIKKG